MCDFLQVIGDGSVAQYIISPGRHGNWVGLCLCVGFAVMIAVLVSGGVMCDFFQVIGDGSVAQYVISPGQHGNWVGICLCWGFAVMIAVLVAGE